MPQSILTCFTSMTIFLHWFIGALVQNLDQCKLWWRRATCIGSKVGHQVASMHCLELPYWHYQLVLSWYLHQPESHQLSVKKWRTDGLTSDDPDPKIGPKGHLGPIMTPSCPGILLQSLGDQLVIVPWRDPFIRLLL